MVLQGNPEESYCVFLSYHSANLYKLSDINKTLFRLKKSNEMQHYADIYLLLIYFTYFGRPSRPSPGVHKTVVAASGTDRTIWGASFLKRDQIRTDLGHV